MPPPEVSPKTVRPRKPVKDHRQIMAVDSESFFDEATGEIQPLAKLPAALHLRAPLLLACYDAGDVLGLLHRHFEDDPTWQFRVTPVEREVWTPDERRRKTIVDLIVHFAGFKVNSRKTRYHYLIDPIRYSRDWVDHERDCISLFVWASSFRAFCDEQQIKVSPSPGGISAQFLRDPRFYPDARRRVPRLTNEKTRERLPGNHYENFSSPQNQVFPEAHYLDQHKAHHSAAATIDLPNANDLFARGRFLDMAERPWLRGEQMENFLATQHGLVHAKVTPCSPHKPMVPVAFQTDPCWLYTCELEFFRSLGGTIHGLHSAWTSPTVDSGIKAYAEWSLAQETQESWKKTVLLSAYGLLAAKPKHLCSIYAQADSEEVTLIAGGRRIKGYGKETTRLHSSALANVIQRGMIEAEVRRRSLHLARDLRSRGLQVVSVYSDAVFVDARSGPLPLPEAPWRLKGTLHGLRFLNPTAFISRELTKFPGIPAKDIPRRLQGLGVERNAAIQ